MHIYGRVAAEEVLATFLSALLRPRSGRSGFSKLSKRTFTRQALAVGQLMSRHSESFEISKSAEMSRPLQRRGVSSLHAGMQCKVCV